MNEKQPAQGTDYRAYLKLIYRRRYLFIFSSLAIMTVAVVSGYVLPKVYRAESTVMVERNFINVLMKDIAVSPSIEERVRVLSSTLLSRQLLSRVIDDLRLDAGKHAGERENLIKHFQGTTEITETKDGRNRGEMQLFKVSYRSNNPQLATNYINTLIKRYIEESLAAKREEAFGASKFIEGQMELFRQKIEKIENDIIDFRKAKGIFVSVDEKKVVQEIKDAQDRIDELQIQKMELKAKKDRIAKQLNQEKPYTVAVFGRNIADNPKTRLIMLQKNLNELLARYTERYPEVIKVRAEIELLKKMADKKDTGGESIGAPDSEMSTLNPLYQQLKEEAARTEIALAAAQTRESHLGKQIEIKKELLRNLPVEKKRLSEMENERDNYKKIHQDLVAKLGQSEVSTQLESQEKGDTFRIVDPAVLPLKPVSPNTVKIILAGIFLGIAGGTGLVLLLDRMDQSTKSVDALKAVNVPVLAVIPFIQNAAESEMARKKDRMIYGFAGIYFLCILAIFTAELMR